MVLTTEQWDRARLNKVSEEYVKLTAEIDDVLTRLGSFVFETSNILPETLTRIRNDYAEAGWKVSYGTKCAGPQYNPYDVQTLKIERN